MAMAEFYEGEPIPQVPEDMRFVAGALVAYLDGQFSDARRKEGAEDERSDFSAHGSFINQVPIENGHMLTRGSERIVLKPPHPNDTPGTFCEVYAIEPYDPDNQDEQTLLEQRFLVRESLDGQIGPFRLVDQFGAHPAEVDADVSYLFGNQPQDPLLPFVWADELFERLSTYNIVASNE